MTGKIIYTFSLALMGGFLGYKLKIPAGGLIGAMLAVGLANIAGLSLYGVPPAFRVLAQIIVGAILGIGITKETFLGLKALWLPALIIVFIMISTGIICGYLLFRVTKMDLVTALFSSSPGGLTELTLVSQGMGADAPKVALLHLARITCAITIIPFLVKWIGP